ncbi:asparaginase [Kytococcus aerolatus]|uniref:Asparaginase n=1 Tax=Kytococcus aerolatus TaxID=592308 RepID=A0A212U5Z6_9MICO|nr:asparaginase [Kytococcus aerolatus]SNC73649.1 asparaginase [Kytococcus aerolatus]
MTAHTPAAHASPLAEAPVVAHVVRGELVESVHHGLVVVTSLSGEIELAVGEVDAPMFPRSSNKPMQAVGMLRAGAELDGPHLALACASHSGEAFHLEAVRQGLAAVGLDESYLQNTPSWPIDDEARAAYLAAGGRASSLAQNCSGKHAGMLAACVAAGWGTQTYRELEHPLQQEIRRAMEELSGDAVEQVAVDGCGAPVMSLSLAGLARSFGRIASAEDGPEATVARAMREHPQYVGGTRREVTALMRALPGSIAKDGAEAVLALGLPDGRGLAVKITDGQGRACHAVMVEALRALGTTHASLDRLAEVPIMGHGRQVGQVLVTDTVRAGLRAEGGA